MLTRIPGPLLLLLALMSAHPALAAPGPDAYERIFDATLKGISPDAYVQEINSGWAKSHDSLRASLKKDRSYIVLHSIEPGPIFDLRSTEHFRKSLNSSKGLVKLLEMPLSIGHVFVSWRCDVGGGRFVEGTTGITGELDRQAFQMMMKGWGFTAFFSQFTDGHLQTPKLLAQEFDHARAMHNLAVEVEPQICRNAMQFVSDFIHHENKPYKNFGPGFDPTKFEGGGCGSFGVSVLQKSGFFGKHDFWTQLWRTMQARGKLFGYGIESVPKNTIPFDMKKQGRNKIKMLRLLARKWDDQEGSGPSIRQQDPEMLLLFLKALYRLNLPQLRGEHAEEFAKTSEFEVRSYVTGFRRTKIDSTFDPQAANVVRLTARWMNDLKSDGYKPRLGKIGWAEKPYTVLILDR